MIDSFEVRKIGNSIEDFYEEIERSLRKVDRNVSTRNSMLASARRKFKQSTTEEYDWSFRNPVWEFSIHNEIDIVRHHLEEIRKLQWKIKKMIEKSGCYK